MCILFYITSNANTAIKELSLFIIFVQLRPERPLKDELILIWWTWTSGVREDTLSAITQKRLCPAQIVFRYERGDGLGGLVALDDVSFSRECLFDPDNNKLPDPSTTSAPPTSATAPCQVNVFTTRPPACEAQSQREPSVIRYGASVCLWRCRMASSSAGGHLIKSASRQLYGATTIQTARRRRTRMVAVRRMSPHLSSTILNNNSWVFLVD